MSRPPRAVERPTLNDFGTWRVVLVGAVVLFTYFSPLQRLFDTEAVPLYV